MEELSGNEMLMWAIIDGDLEAIKRICELPVGLQIFTNKYPRFYLASGLHRK